MGGGKTGAVLADSSQESACWKLDQASNRGRELLASSDGRGLARVFLVVFSERIELGANMRSAVLLSASVFVASVSLGAAKPEQARIPFATSSGIESWRATDDDVLYIKGRNEQWYKAELFGPCIGLEFDPTIGFVVRYGSTFERGSSVLVEGRECRVSSLVKVAAPPRENESGSANEERVTARAGGDEERANDAQRSNAQRSNDDSDGSSRQARIPFANLGGIRDWRAVSDEVLYVEGRGDQWYRVDLMAPCRGLQFEQSVGFVAEPTGSFDRFSSIVVDGRECQVTSVSPGSPPSSRQAAKDQ